MVQGSRALSVGYASLTGDVDGDGQQDLVFVDDASVVTHLASGTMVTTSAPKLPRHVALADKDLDGALDLVWLSADERIRSARGHRNGSFAFDSTQPTADSDRRGVIGFSDVDRNGMLDAIIADYYGNGLVVAFATDGESRRGPINVYSPGSNRVAAVADFDGDNATDVLFDEGQVVSIKPDGTLTPLSYLTTAEGYRSSTRLIIIPADIDGDGDIDLVTPSGGRDSIVSVWLNDSTGHFARPPACKASSSLFECSLVLDFPGKLVAAADVDADGRADLVVEFTDGGPPLVLISHGAGDGTFSPWKRFLASTAYAGFAGIHGGKVLFSGSGGLYVLPASCL